MKKKIINEMLGVIFAAIALFLFFSLLWNDPADNAFYTSHPNAAIHNVTGILGAYISHYLMFAFGMSAFTFPLIFAFWATSFFLQKLPEKVFYKLLGFLIFQSSAATLFSLLAPQEAAFTMGGIWGYVLSTYLSMYCGPLGSFIIALCCFCLSFILATEYLIFPYLSKGFIIFCDMLVALGKKILEVFLSKKETTREQKRIRTKRVVQKKEVKKPTKKKKVVNEAEEEEDEEEEEEALEAEAPLFKDLPELKVRKYDPNLVEEERLKEERKKEASARRTARKKDDEIEDDSKKGGVSVFSEHGRRAEDGSTYEFPPFELLNKPETVHIEDNLTENSHVLETCLREFGIEVRVTEIEQGPVITRYEIMPAPGVKISSITALHNDIALAMKAKTVRLIAPIPGKSAVGIEVPNSNANIVYLRELLQNRKKIEKARIPLVFGKDTSGKPVIADLAEMPHLLIAGATGSGKTVCINSLMIALFYCLSPDELKLIMIDPKRVELACYNDIPYMLAPVVTNPKKAAATLNWVVNEMENRYKLFAKVGVRNIQSYNERQAELAEESGGDDESHDEEIVPDEEDTDLQEEESIDDELGDEKDSEEDMNEEEEELPPFLPYIVVVVDELADLMLVAADKVETAITRLAQLSRATGIHLMLATQRPSVDVITGVIKANFPSRVSFKVSSMTDSRTVLDTKGADMLVGKGDMLFMEPGRAKPLRAQGTLITDKEINAVVTHIKKLRKPEYNLSIQEASSSTTSGTQHEKDEMFNEAVRVIVESKQASVSILQRRLRLGYTRAARIIDMMEAEGIVGPYQGSKPRDLLVGLEYLDDLKH